MLTVALPHRVIASACLLALGLIGACGGQEVGSGGTGGSSGSAGSSGSGGSGGTGGSISDAGNCVDVVLSTYSKSCDSPSDCILITAGEVCTGDCNCEGSPVSASEEARYKAATAGIELGTCFCAKAPVPQCIDHTCTLAGEDDSGTTSTSDGGEVEAGSTCADIELSSYDQTCTKTSDCIEITSGEICPTSCLCGGSTINKDGQAKYEAAISGIKTQNCPCAAGPIPSCVHGKCTMPLPP
jgi:hypothetical protein